MNKISSPAGVYYQFSIFKKYSEIKHGIFPRTFGNISFEFEEAEKNRRTIAKILKIPYPNLISAWQVHGKKALIIRSKTDLFLSEEEKMVDALITKLPKIGLVVKTADCQPVLIFDPVQKVVAALHVGWRGSNSNLIFEVVSVLQKEFKSNPEDLKAGIGPSLGPCCAFMPNPSPEMKKYLKKDKVDFWQMSLDQFQEAGVPLENIELSKICTACNLKEWFSYRGDHPDQGRFGSIISLC